MLPLLTLLESREFGLVLFRMSAARDLRLLFGFGLRSQCLLFLLLSQPLIFERHFLAFNSPRLGGAGLVALSLGCCELPAQKPE